MRWCSVMVLFLALLDGVFGDISMVAREGSELLACSGFRRCQFFVLRDLSDALVLAGSLATLRFDGNRRISILKTDVTSTPPSVSASDRLKCNSYVSVGLQCK